MQARTSGHKNNIKMSLSGDEQHHLSPDQV